MQKKLLLIIGLFLFFVSSTDVAFAQSATAALSITVVDEKGASVSGANVVITDKAKAFERTATTNSA